MENETMHTYKVILKWDFESRNPLDAATEFEIVAQCLSETYGPTLEVRQFVDTDKPDLRFEVHLSDGSVKELPADGLTAIHSEPV